MSANIMAPLMHGSEEVERFGSAVKNVHDVANKLGRFLKPNEMSSIIEKCFIGILSKEFTINCLISFVYTQGAEKLLETSLCHMKDEFTLEILSKIPFSLQLLDVINQVKEKIQKAYASAYEMMFAYYDLVMDEGIFIEEQTYVMLMNFFAHCEKILRINLNPENWKDMKWDEIIDNQINEENKITCHLRNKIRSC